MVRAASEQRRFTRMLLNRPALLQGPRGAVEGRLRDISLSGACLELLGAWTAGSDARYGLTTDLAPGASVSMQLSLIYRRGSRAGFRCERLDTISLGHIRQLLTLYLGNTPALDREIEAAGRLNRHI